MDTPYSTNKYKLSALNIIGIDSNGKNVSFGIGLLSKEDKESFT